MDGRIVLPKFAEAGAFPAAAGFGLRLGWQMSWGKCVRTKAATD